MDESISKKRRARVSNSPDSDGDRRRGRPRVEKQDESAADRRRTQIRMAQRAYRQRKESTLEELRRRVSDLTNTIELMNKTFVDYRDRLYDSNPTQAQFQDIYQASEKFEELVKDARNPDDDNLPACPKTTHRTSASRAEDIEMDLTVSAPDLSHLPSWMDKSAVAQSKQPKAREDMDAVWGYYPVNEESMQGIDDLDFSNDSQEIVRTQKHQQVSPSDSFDILRAELPDSFTVAPQLPPPTTYSFQETTFGRRLHRACIEQAYRLLLNPLKKPAAYERVFRLSLMGRNRHKLAETLKAILDRGPHESLDFWQAPLIHVGGAGTHYPRRDPFGNVLPMRTSHNLGIIGPQNLALLENAFRDNISIDMTVEVAGFEGEWLDPYDVQGYLEEKAIFIDPTSSFADAEIIEWPDTPSSASNVSSPTLQSPPQLLGSQSKATPISEDQLNLFMQADADLSQWNDLTNMQLTGVGYSSADDGSWMNFLQPGQAIKPHNPTGQPDQSVDWFTNQHNMDYVQDQKDMSLFSISQPPSPPRRKNVIVDVSKLVKVLTLSSYCLGRSPGFRRRDVDRALAISSFDA